MELSNEPARETHQTQINGDHNDPSFATKDDIILCTEALLPGRGANEDEERKSHDSDDADDDDVFDEVESRLEKEEEEEEGFQRASWGGKLEFLFTIIGSAVGLGNIWRFPYLCYKNGGGAFLLPYLIMLGIVGFPMFFLELAFAQFASLGPITIWKINPLFKGLGYAMVAVSAIIGIYYNIIISHVLLFLFVSLASIRDGLPWTSCGNWWNTEHCYVPDYGGGGAKYNASGAEYGNDTETLQNSTLPTAVDNKTVTIAAGLGDQSVFTGTVTAAEEFYNHYILEISSGIEEGGGLNWKLALCLLLAWIIVLVCLIRGIKSLGKVAYFTALFPYIMLTILLIRGVTLKGAGGGILYYIRPDFQRLKDPRVWSDAATQIFYSLSACTGSLLTMASYNKFNNNVYKDTLIVGFVDAVTSVYSGLVIFSILGFMAAEKGVLVADVATGGPGLAFVVYPEAISRMPAPVLWAIFFFIMMSTLGFGSEFAIVECVLGAVCDEYPGIMRSRWKSIAFRSGVILFAFLIGLPMVSRGGIYILELVDYSVSGFPLLIIGLMECAALCWVYGYENFAADIALMIGKKPSLYWKICWKYVTPGIVMILVLSNCALYKPPSYGETYQYPPWAQAMGWLIAMFPLFLIVFFFFWRYCREGGLQLTKQLMQPKEKWGPLLKEHRQGTLYEDTVALADEEEWGYDFRDKLDMPHTITLTMTPAGSMVNLANVQNYTGPVPLVWTPRMARRRNMSPANRNPSPAGTPLLQRALRNSGRRMSRSFSHLPTLKVDPPKFGNLLSPHGSSVGNLHQGHVTKSQQSLTSHGSVDLRKSQWTKPERSDYREEDETQLHRHKSSSHDDIHKKET